MMSQSMVMINRYPERAREDVKHSCPFCCGICNCKACLQANVTTKVFIEFLLFCFHYHIRVACHSLKFYFTRLAIKMQMKMPDWKKHFICWPISCLFSDIFKESRGLSSMLRQEYLVLEIDIVIWNLVTYLLLK